MNPPQPALRFSWSRPRRLALMYLIGVGAFVVVCSPLVFLGVDRADYPDPTSGGLETLAVGVGWLALTLWLYRASVTADETGIRTQALIIRFIRAADVVDITVGVVPHGIYTPSPLAPYVVRRNGRRVKLAPMERLDVGNNSELLTEQCRQLLAVVGVATPDAGAANDTVIGHRPGPHSIGLSEDPGSGVLVPEGTTLASRGRRLAAFLVFAGYNAVLIALGYLIFPYFTPIGAVVVALILSYLGWGVVLWRHNQTPAFLILRMRVWSQRNEGAAGWSGMALRELVGGLAELILFPITLLVSIAMLVFGAQRQALRDVIAGTLVLHDPHHALAEAHEARPALEADGSRAHQRAGRHPG